MKKYLLNLTTILMVAIMSGGFVSCGDDDKEDAIENTQSSSIIGTWTWIERDGSYTFSMRITFNSDGTYRSIIQENSSNDEEYGKWTYDTNDYRLTLTTISGEKPEAVTFTVKWHGNKMTLIDPDGDVYGPFTKQ